MKIGIIGAGLIGRKRAQALAADHGGSRLEVVADVDIDKAKYLAGRYGGAAFDDWKEALRRTDLDALVIATPNKFALPIALAAMDRIRAVLCEKPLGRNLQESLRILDAARKNQVVLKTGFNHRHHPAIKASKSLVDSGALGEIYSLRCVYGHGGRNGYEREWRADKDLCGGGELLDQGVHIVDLFRWFLGEFHEISGWINTYYWPMTVEDNAFAVLRTRKGQTAMMHTSWTQWKNKFLLEIFGEKGYLIVEGLGGSYGVEKLTVGRRLPLSEDKGSETGTRPRYASGPPEEETIIYDGPDVSWEEEWKEFVSAVRDDREPLGSGRDGMMANRLIDSIYRSASLQKPVMMPSL